MNELDNEEIRINEYSLQTKKGRIAPMAEQRFEAPWLQVRILFRPQTKRKN
jgi:hypothetical protein